MWKLSNLQALLIALILGGYPLSAALGSALGVESTPLSIAARGLTLAVAVVLVLFALPNTRVKHPRYAFLFWAFWIAYLVRIYIDTSTAVPQLLRPPADYWVWALCICLLPSLGLMGVSNPEALRKGFYLSLAALGTAAALTLIFGSGFVIRFDGTEANIGRLSTESLNPISAGHLGASLFILAGWSLVYGYSGSQLVRALGLTGLLCGAALLISAASRGPIAALACVMLVALVGLQFHNMVKVAVMGLLVAVIAAMLLTSVAQFEELSVINRMMAAASGEDMAVSSRQESFAGAWNQFLKSPVFGDFLEERDSGFYPHNLPLEAFMATGLVGGLAFLAICWVGFSKAYRAIRDKAPYAWVALIFIQYLVGAQFSGSLYGSSTFWGFAVLMLFAASRLESRPSSTPGLSRSPGQTVQRAG
jgi:O-antigen ligase